MQRPPRTPFEKTPSPDFDLKAEGEAILKAFPHMVGKLFYLDVQTCDIHDMAPIPSEMIYDYRVNKTSACYQSPHNADIFFILFSTRNHETFLGIDVDKNQQLHFVFDHETAHALIPKKGAQSQLSESIADAYALLRHYQRYGIESNFGEQLMFRRAARALFSPKNKPIHFTNPALERIVWMRKQWGIENMSPENTVKLAHILGEKYALQNKELRSVHRDFKKVAKHITQIQTRTKRAYEVARKTPRSLSRKWALYVLDKITEKHISAETKNICCQPSKSFRRTR